MPILLKKSIVLVLLLVLVIDANPPAGAGTGSDSTFYGKFPKGLISHP